MFDLIATTFQGLGFASVILIIIFIIWMIVEQIQCARISRDREIEKNVIERVNRKFEGMDSRLTKLETQFKVAKITRRVK